MCRASGGTGQHRLGQSSRIWLFDVKGVPFGRAGGRPARCGRHASGRRPRSRRPSTTIGARLRARHPACQLAGVRRTSVARPRAPSHQSLASTPRVQGAPASRHYVIGRARPWTRSGPAYDRQLRGAGPGVVDGTRGWRRRAGRTFAPSLWWLRHATDWMRDRWVGFPSSQKPPQRRSSNA